MKLRKAAIPAILALASLGNAQVSAPPFAILRSAPSAESRTRGLVRLTLDLRTGARGCQALDVFQLTPSDVTWPRWRANVTTRVKVVDGRTLTVYASTEEQEEPPCSCFAALASRPTPCMARLSGLSVRSVRSSICGYAAPSGARFPTR